MKKSEPRETKDDNIRIEQDGHRVRVSKLRTDSTVLEIAYDTVEEADEAYERILRNHT